MHVDYIDIDYASNPGCPEELENNINSDLCKIKEYFDIIILSLNVPKCELMLTGTYHAWNVYLYWQWILR